MIKLLLFTVSLWVLVELINTTPEDFEFYRDAFTALFIAILLRSWVARQFD